MTSSYRRRAGGRSRRSPEAGVAHDEGEREAARAMSIAPATGDDDQSRFLSEDLRDSHAPGVDGILAPSQSAWFGLADEESPASGVHAGLVFNRPIEQVLTYRVPARLAGSIRVGQRVRVAARAGGQAGLRVLRPDR